MGTWNKRGIYTPATGERLRHLFTRYVVRFDREVMVNGRRVFICKEVGHVFSVAQEGRPGVLVGPPEDFVFMGSEEGADWKPGAA